MLPTCQLLTLGLRSTFTGLLAFLAIEIQSSIAAEPASSIRFVDVTQSAGLVFAYHNGSAGQRFMIEKMGAGLACFDADNDGWLDIFFPNGTALPVTATTASPSDSLFRNLHTRQFADVTRAAGCSDSQFGLGAVAADYDNDGFQDLYISNFGPNRLLHNNGDGTFSDVTTLAKVADGSQFAAGATFVDIDRDGDLDLFSANYIVFSFEHHAKLAPVAYPYSPGPRDFPSATDTLFLNQGDGTFSDISHTSGIASVAGPSMGVIAGDFDADGDDDIFVACDGAPNLYYLNDGQGRFSEQAILFGLAYDLRGNANGNMGVDAADIDGDGLFDLLVTDYARQLPIYFQNIGQGMFDDVSRISQIGTELLSHVTWGVGLVDFENDGDSDAFLCAGHLLENAHEFEPDTAYNVRNSIMENMGNNRFRSATNIAGQAVQQTLSSRGAIFDDLDNDGHVDCAVLNSGAPAQLLFNQSLDNNHWIEIELCGRHSNRDALGSRVRIVYGDQTQVAEVRNGRGYQSQYGKRLHFGLGDCQHIERIEVQWPSNETLVLEQVTVDQLLHIIEP